MNDRPAKPVPVTESSYLGGVAPRAVAAWVLGELSQQRPTSADHTWQVVNELIAQCPGCASEIVLEHVRHHLETRAARRRAKLRPYALENEARQGLPK